MKQKLPDAHFSLADVARYLGRSPDWIQQHMRGPAPLPGFRIGKVWLFRRSEIDLWLEQFRESPPPLTDPLTSALEDLNH